MKEICYYEADDGTRFDNRWDCVAYERQKQLKECENEFVFLNCRKEKLAFEDASTENVYYMIIKTDRAARVIGNWFDDDGCLDPFDGFYEGCIGTWVWGEEIDKGDGWLKLELEIEKLQTLLEEIN